MINIVPGVMIKTDPARSHLPSELTLGLQVKTNVMDHDYILNSAVEFDLDHKLDH